MLRQASASGLILVVVMAIACQRTSDDLDFHRGRNALAEARHDQARHYFTLDLEPHPTRFESWRGLGIAWSSGTENSQSRAILAFRKALELQPEDPETRWCLALALHHRGADDEALSVLEPVLESGGDEPEAKNVRATIEKVPGTLNRDILKLRIALLRARLRLDEDPAASWRVIENALVTFPQEAALLAAAAKALERMREPERALDFARQALAVDPFLKHTVYLQARMLRRQGDIEGAERALKLWDLLRRLPEPTAPPTPEVWQVIQELSAILGDAPDVRMRQARFLLQQRQFEEASVFLDALLSEDHLSIGSALDLGRLAQKQGRTGLAQRLYQAVLDQQPDHLAALAQQAYLAVEVGRPQQAATFVERGLAIDDHHAPFHFVTGLLAEESEDAIPALSRAVELAPWQPRYRLALAEVYLTLGRRDALEDLFDDAPAAPELEAFAARHLW